MSEWRGTLEQAMDLHEVGLGGELCHLCLGLDLKRLSQAKDLRRAGLVTIENSPDGPMVTRTWRGSQTLKNIKAAQRNHERACNPANPGGTHEDQRGYSRGRRTRRS